MGRVKSDLLNKNSNSKNQYKLTDYEYNFVKDLDTSLRTSIYHKRLMSGMLTYIAKTRLKLVDPPEGFYFQFQIDLSGDDHTLTVTTAVAEEK
jgi:hypothetical protein